MGIKLKRSAVASKVPVVADLEPGELAVNTWDGKLYLKKNDGADAIVEIGPVRSVAGRTGAVALAIADVSSLQTALDGKQAAGSYAAASHTHAISSVTGLQAALDGKANLADIVGRQSIWVPAPAMHDSGNAPLTTIWPSGGSGYRVLLLDPFGNEGAYFSVQMPRSWNKGPVSARFVWSHAATSTSFGVRWEVYAIATGDGENLGGISWSAVARVTDTGGNTDHLYISPETPALAPEGTAGDEDLVSFYVGRQATDAADTMAIDARLHGVFLYYTTSAARDN
jgi:hypothetical protein